MKKIYYLIFSLGLLISAEANAWFFFWLPTGKIAQAIRGLDGENCVSNGASVGDMVKLPNGDIGKVVSLAGTTSDCANPELPIRAKVEKVSVEQRTTEAQFDIPDGWEQKNLTDAQKRDGFVLYALNKPIDSGLMLAVLQKSSILDIEAYVAARKAAQEAKFDNLISTPVAKIVVNGLPVWRFEVAGNLKTGSRPNLKYFISIYESATEVVLLSEWTTAANFDNQVEHFKYIANSISGLTPPLIIDKPTKKNAAKEDSSQQVSKVGKAKATCKEIGFKTGTDDFKNCVMKVIQ